MSTNEKNSYLKKARQKALNGAITAQAGETKNDLKKTAAVTGRDILFGGLAGSLAGALIGRSSLLLGVLVTGTGHFLGSPATAMVGVGMMASGGYQNVNAAMNGTEKEGMEGIKERFTSFKENLKRQLFLDKLKGKKKSDTKKEEEKKTEATNGMGEVQYFTHPSGKLDFSEAEKLEAQIAASGQQFAQKHGVNGEVGNLEGEFGSVEERIL